MARKKVRLAWIQNDAARRATFKKRRKGLLKKVSELSILCDVQACAIVYAPNEPNPEVWPSVEEATAVLNRFKSMPEMEQTKKMMSQEGFLEERIKKAQNQWKRLHEENQQTQLLAFMYQCFGGRTLQNLGFEEVCHLSWLLESKLKVVHERIETLRLQPPMIAAVPPAANNTRQSAIYAVGTSTATTDLVPYTLQNQDVDVVSQTMPLPSMEMEHMDPSMEMMRRQEMFMYNSQMFWQGAEETVLPPFMDVGNNFAKPYPDSNQSWVDAYFHN